MKKDENCIFCKIIEGKIPADIVYEDEKIVAFLDIYPVNKGHTLIVPKSHSRNLLDDDDSDLDACMKAIKKVGNAIMPAVGAQGFNLIANTNPAAGQVVFHTHFHLIPRFEHDGLKHWPGNKLPDEEMKKIKNSIEKRIEKY